MKNIIIQINQTKQNGKITFECLRELNRKTPFAGFLRDRSGIVRGSFRKTGIGSKQYYHLEHDNLYYNFPF